MPLLTFHDLRQIVMRMDDAGFKLIKHARGKTLLTMPGHGLVNLLNEICVGLVAVTLVTGVKKLIALVRGDR